jgi:4'-phosphopantetheinyl transferase
MSRANWAESPVNPRLAGHDLHVWLAHVPALRGALDRFAAVLAPDEKERIARYRFPEHRERSQVARGLLRLLLSGYVAEDPAALSFRYNTHGKPDWAGEGLHFNTSHSGDYVVLAFTRVGPVGVDIEQVRTDMARRDEIAQRHFAPGERAQLVALPEGQRTRAFFDLWTRKEAFVKARGDGLFSGLDQFETWLAEPRVLSVRGAPAVNWWMSDLPEVTGYSGAVVVQSTACVPCFWLSNPENWP